MIARLVERLVAFALGRRLATMGFVAGLVVAGAVALDGLPVEAFPDVQDVQVQVVTLSPGQSPEDVERTVTLPIEREMAATPRAVGVRSVTMSGLSVVTLTFADGTDDYFARQQVLEKLGTVTLPANVQAQLAPLTTAVGEVYRYAIHAPAMASVDVRTLQDWVIRPALRRTPGVADVVSFGGTIRQWQVDVDPLALRKYQVTLDQVNQAIVNGTGSAGGNLLRRGDETTVVRTAGLYRSPDDVAGVAVATRQGRPIRIGELADVHAGERAPTGIVAADDADDVVEGIVVMTKGGDAATVDAALRQRIADVQHRLPTGATIVPIYDRTVLVHETVSTVTENLLVGAFLVVAVLVVFLTSWRAALVVASVIPLALLFAFLLMRVVHVSANLISLGAVDFGIIVDSAVVLVEALMVRLAAERGPASDTRTDAGGRGRIATLRDVYRQLSRSVGFAKAIIIVAFVPIFTFQRVEGRIFTPVALTLSFALVGALVMTFTWVPAVLAWLLSRRTLVERHKPWLARLQAAYRRALQRTFARAGPMVAVAAIVLVVAFALAPALGTEFLPKLDEGNIWLTVTLPTSASLDVTKRVERAVRERLRAYPEVVHVISQTGRPDDGSDPKGPNSIELLVDLAPHGSWRWSDKDAMIEDMERHLHDIPGIATNFSQVIEDNVEEALSGSKGEIVAKISGPDLAILDRKASQVAAVVRSVPGASDVDVTRLGGQAELVIVPDRARLARYGLSVNDVNTLITEALSGAPAASYFDGERRFDIVARVGTPRTNSIDAIATLALPMPDDPTATAVPAGSPSVALSDVARIDVRQGASTILHDEGARTAIVKMNIVGRDQGGFVAEARERVAAQVELPAGYELVWGGQFENSRRAAKRLAWIVPMTAALILGLLYAAFRSLAHAALILATVPFTMVGGFAVLAMAGLHLSVSAAVGFIAVAGISVQNGVILVEALRRRVDVCTTVDDAFGDALVDSAVDRLRPILMTALMVGLGLLPAALSHGIGSETQRPFACVIVGGIVGGTLFTLFLLPLGARRLARRAADRVGPTAPSASLPTTPVTSPIA